MADILHDFPIRATPDTVFTAISTPASLDAWWTLSSAGTPAMGEPYDLSFGPGYDWTAVVSRCVPAVEFQLEMAQADQDWLGSRVTFSLSSKKTGVTTVRFQHTGWPHINEHYRISCFCWAMYLRLLKRYVETGEVVPYEDRLDA